jgi:CBS domain-containing protein
MKVRDAMAKTIGTAAPSDSVRRVATLMREEGAGFLPVCDGEQLVGVITDRDIVIRCIAEGGADALELPIDRCMSRGVHTASPDEELESAARMMEREEVRRLAVVEDGRLVGVLSHGNVVQALQGGGPAQQATVGVTQGA